MSMKDFKPICAYICELELHDYVMYTSRDFGRLAVTEDQVISNYALTYAIGRGLAFDNGKDLDQNRKGDICFPKSRIQQAPTYKEDFADLSVYVTPAVAVFRWQKTKTYNTIPEIYGERTKPKYGDVVPSFGRYTVIGIGSRFAFVIFSEVEDIAIPRYIRLGKFMASAEIYILDKCEVTLYRDKFKSLPFHIKDLPSGTIPNTFDLIRLGKGHGVIFNAELEADFWKLDKSKVNLFSRNGLLKGVYYCARET